jgi:hypothetical protein
MYSLQYLNKKKIIEKFSYNTLEEAQDSINENDIWNNSTSYKIINLLTDEIEEEEEFEDSESIRKMMFPDEDSEEGFDFESFTKD